MKKKLENSDEAASDQQEVADYVVGLVSGSLFQQKKKKKKKKEEEESESAAAGSSLSSLFSSATAAVATATTTSLLFQPAPKLEVQKSEEKQQDETPEVKGQTGQKKKTTKVKTAGEEKLENRESALQEADEDERGQETKTAAAKRKRKAAALESAGGEKEAELWVMKRQREKANKQEEAVKRKRTVFVGNLPVSCTKKTLRSLFRDKGSIESIRFRSVVREDPTMSRKVAAIQRKIHPKKQSVNAYVVFKDDEGVAKALERNGLEIEKDFHIRVDRVADGSTQHDHKRSVFVGNLSFEISDLAFRRHFEDCGPVEAVRLVRDRDSGMGKGFGYVLFEGADSVQLALKLDGSKLEGRSVRVKRSVKKEKEKKNKTNSGSNNAGTAARAGRKGPAKGPGKGPGKSGGFKFPKKFTGNQPRPTKSSGSFKGEMVDPTKKTKKKLKRKVRPKKKSLHI